MKKHRLLTLICLLGSLATTAAGTASAQTRGACDSDGRPGGDWPMYGQNLQGTRNQTAEKQISPSTVGKLRPAWVAPVASQATPVIAGTCVYTIEDATAGQTNLVALNIDSGAVVWKAQLPVGVTGSVLTAGQAGSVAVADGRVHISLWVPEAQDGTPGGGQALAFDANTGKELWKSEVIQFGQTTGVISSAMVYDGIQTVMTFGPDGGQYARPGYALIDAATGETLYKQATMPQALYDQGYAGGGMWGTPVFDPLSGFMYNGTANPYSAKRQSDYDDAILKFDVDRTRTTFGKIVGHMKGSPDGFFGSYENLPTCGEGGSVIDPKCGHLDLDFVSPVLFHDSQGEALVGSLQRDGRFHVADAATMTEKWVATVSSPSVIGGEAAAAADEKTVYVAANGGPVYALDVDTGQIKWVTPVPSVLSYAPLSLANGVLFVPASMTGEVTALNAADGTPLWVSDRYADAAASGGKTDCLPIGGGVAIGRGYVIATCDSKDTIAYKIDPNAPPVPVGSLPGGGGGPGLPPLPPVGPPSELPTGAGTPVVAAPAGNVTGFVPQAYVVQGQKATFVNADTTGVHDVASEAKTSTGQRLFKSADAAGGQAIAIEGTEKLAPGDYPFICLYHGNMKGTLTVLAPGAKGRAR